MPTIITATTTTTTKSATAKHMFYGSRLGQLESNNKELSKSQVEVLQGRGASAQQTASSVKYINKKDYLFTLLAKFTILLG